MEIQKLLENNNISQDTPNTPHEDTYFQKIKVKYTTISTFYYCGDGRDLALFLYLISYQKLLEGLLQFG